MFWCEFFFKLVNCPIIFFPNSPNIFHYNNFFFVEKLSWKPWIVRMITSLIAQFVLYSRPSHITNKKTYIFSAMFMLFARTRRESEKTTLNKQNFQFPTVHNATSVFVWFSHTQKKFIHKSFTQFSIFITFHVHSSD